MSDDDSVTGTTSTTPPGAGGSSVVDLRSTAPVTNVDPDEFARLAAEVVALIEHHRRELADAMAELTALQRAVRGEIRDAVAELQRVAAGEVAAAVPAPAEDPGTRRRFGR